MATPDPLRRRWDPKDPVAPFMDGSLQHYPEMRGWGEAARFPEWRHVVASHMTLTLDGYARGRSAAYFTFVDEAGNHFPMMLADFAELVRTRMPLAPGKFFALWAVAKRGQNYGIRLAKEGDR